MENNPIITLTTDFGYREPFSGILKGVVLGINPSAVIIDITHGIEKFNIREAALTIGFSYRHFPSRTIHVVVTDPGVGSGRRPILVVTGDYFFVGPDNGIFSPVYDESERCEVFHLTAEHYFLRGRSATFHARDIFAPVAAWLSKGLNPSFFGEPITDYMKLSFPVPSMPTKTCLKGEVIHTDHFGNAITNIGAGDLNLLLAEKPDGALEIVSKDMRIPLKKFYREAEGQGLCALMNSIDRLELFVYKKDASSEFDIKIGDAVEVLLI